MGALNKTYCEFADVLPTAIKCKAEENFSQPCAFLRYCTQESCWYHSNDFNKCKVRIKNLSKEKKDDSLQDEQKNIEGIKIEDQLIEPLKKVDIEEKKDLNDKKTSFEEKEKQTGIIISIEKNWYVVKDEKGNGIRVNGKCLGNIGDPCLF